MDMNLRKKILYAILSVLTALIFIYFTQPI